MYTPDRQITPGDYEPKHCENEGCNEGYIYTEYVNDDNEPYLEREKCPYCEDGFIID